MIQPYMYLERPSEQQMLLRVALGKDEAPIKLQSHLAQRQATEHVKIVG